MTAATRTSGATMRAQAEEALTSGGRGLARLGLLVLGILPVTVLPFLAAVMAGGAVVSALDPYAMAELFAMAAAGLVGAAVAALFVRRVSRRTRDQLSRWCGMRLPVSYTPRPALERDERGHWWTGYSYHRSHSVARVAQLLHWGLRDRATRAEVLWLAVSPIVVLGLAVPVAALLILGLGCTFALNDPVTVDGYGAGGERMLSLVVNGLLGLGLMAVGVAVAPLAVRAYAEIARRVLGQGDRASHAQLTKRVAELTETRADAVGNQAAELRRIERDLHDGAQARLVAIGMTLGTIEHLMDTDPTAARELLSEARQSSARALQELRDLVRGIHPPVLAERGLGDAVRALALDSALPTEVCVSLPDRPPAPVEAAAYFSICELLANAAKHSGAEQVWVDILYRAGTLRITVTDDGAGVADPTRGTGLRGIERRLGTFDGVLAIDSTSGGPTTITLELPCELSSPRTSTSSVKA
ncbi:sensor histidine kinase [Kitasatospora sp. NPDC090091]|uniref:sensor histidine kinase n=1 Tax=Kitasatospora sp. NPDC090091 TaxID=3364081 RepID=UPI003805622C